MKKLLAVIIIIVIAGLTLPKLIGSVVEKEHQAVLDEINTNDVITISAKSFTANWFDGSAITEMTISLADADLPDISLTVEEKILFGPFIFAEDGFHFALSHSTAQINLQELDLDPELINFVNDKVTLTSLLTFSKDMVSRISLKEINKEVDGNHMNISPAFAEFTLSDKTHLSGKVNWDGMAIKNNDANIVVGKVTADFDQTLILGDFYSNNAISTGYAEFLMTSIQGEDLAGNEIINVEQAYIKAQSSVDNELMEINVTYHVDKIVSMGQSFEHANLDLVLENLDIYVLQELNAAFASFSGGEEPTQQEIELLSALGSKLIEKNPIIKMTDLSVTTAEGKFISDMMVSVDQSAYDPANIMTLMMAANAEAKAEAPEALFVKFGLGPMIDMYIDQGLLVRGDDKLSFNTTFTQGQLQVNGLEMPF